jgi:hypothetical protein
MKKIVMIGLVLAVLLVTVAGAIAKGDCDRDMWGHDEQWQSYDGVNEMVLVRTCVDRYNRYNHVDVKNDNDYTICVTIKSQLAGGSWTGWPIHPGDVMSRTSTYSNDTWRIGAKRMEGTYCK